MDGKAYGGCSTGYSSVKVSMGGSLALASERPGGTTWRGGDVETPCNPK